MREKTGDSAVPPVNCFVLSLKYLIAVHNVSLPLQSLDKCFICIFSYYMALIQTMVFTNLCTFNVIGRQVLHPPFSDKHIATYFILRLCRINCDINIKYVHMYPTHALWVVLHYQGVWSSAHEDYKKKQPTSAVVGCLCLEIIEL